MNKFVKYLRLSLLLILCISVALLIAACDLPWGNNNNQNPGQEVTMPDNTNKPNNSQNGSNNGSDGSSGSENDNNNNSSGGNHGSGENPGNNSGGTTTEYDLSGVKFENLTVKYDGQPHSIYASNVPANLGIKYENNAQTEVGKYFVTVKFSNDGRDYDKFPSKIATLTIEKADYDMSRVKFNNLTIGYDGRAHYIYATNLPSGVSVTYQNNGKIELGTYTVTAKFKGDETHYNAIPDKTATLTIKKGEYDMRYVKFNSMSVNYDGRQHSLQVTGVPSGVTVTYINNGQTEPGIYTVTAKFNVDTQHYNTIPNRTATLTINKLTYDMSNVRFDSSTVKYDGQPHSIYATNVPNGVSVSYENNCKTEVGRYTVTANFTVADAQHYNAIPSKSALLTIVGKTELTPLNVTLLNSSVTSWQKGEVDSITVYATGIMENSPPILQVTCGPVGGQSITVSYDKMAYSGDTITITVDMLSFDANQSYELKVNFAVGWEYNEYYTLNSLDTSFDFFSLTIGEQKETGFVLVPDPVPAHKKVYGATGEPISVLLKHHAYLQYMEIVSGSLTQTDVGTHTVKFKIKDGVNAAWATEGPAEREITFELSDRVDIGYVFRRPSLNHEIRYTGKDICVTDYLDGFDPEWMEVMGNESAKVVGDYRVVIMLKDPSNCRWEDGDYFDDDAIHIDWEINKAQVSGSWQMTPEGYEQFVLDDPAMSNFVDFRYYEADADGNPTTPVSLEEMSEEGSYVVVGKVKDEHSGNVGFVIDGVEQGEQISMPFSVT